MTPITVHDARKLVLEAASPSDRVEDVPLADALGRALARSCLADVNVPACDNSAMDGYALRAGDIASSSPNSPIRLPVAATICAGDAPPPPLAAGQAARIFTGAPIPEGADTVLMQEDTLPADSPSHVLATKALAVGRNVRRAGEDLRAGSVAVAAGRLIRPQELGVLASAGCHTLTVVAPPRVAVLSTGSELVGVRDKPRPGQVRNSNAYTLAGLVRESGASPIVSDTVADDLASTRSAIQSALENADLLVTSGGVSVGDYDLVLDALQSLGWTQLFHKVQMKPGHPTAAGVLDGKLVFGLPGNPVSVMVAFLQFVRPALRRILGLAQCLPVELDATLVHPYDGKGNRLHLVSCILSAVEGRLLANADFPQGSGILTTLSRAHALLVVPIGTSHIPAGASVTVQPFRDPLLA